MRISDWSSDVCSSDLGPRRRRSRRRHGSGQVARRLVAHGGEAHAGGGVRLRRVDRRRHLSLGLRLRSHADSPFLPSASSADPSALTVVQGERPVPKRSEEHTSELQSLMRISYAVFCLKKKNNKITLKHK